MKRMSKLVLLAATLAAAQASAAEPVQYWGVHAGVNTLKSLDAKIDFGTGASLPGQVGLERGLHGGLLVGRQKDQMRYEIEYQTGRFDIERLTLASLSQGVDAEGRYQAVFGNVLRTEQVSDSMDGFIGAGIGWGKVTLPLLGLGNCKCFGPAKKSGFAWQLRTGLGYRLGEHHSVALQYTWLNMPEPESDGPPAIRYERRRFGAFTLGYTRQF